MATAQYETRTRTTEETVVVLTLTEDEADALREVVGASDGTRTMVRIFDALDRPTPPEKPASAADTFEYDGVTYDLNAQYVDKDGDIWSFRRRENGDTEGHLQTWAATHWDPYFGLPYVARTYAPLTKVTP